jgi:hypothetical protein
MKQQSVKQYEKRIQQHAVVAQRKMAGLIAFSATLLLLCIENVKAFTAPLANENTLIFLASGAHSLSKRWKVSKSTISISQFSKGYFTANENKKESVNRALQSPLLSRNQRNSLTSLRMAFGFGDASVSAPEMLDMKTSINAFGGWYNKMDPVARPPEYDDDETDYSFSSPADSWPSSFEDDVPVTSMAAYSSMAPSRSTVRKGRKIPRPIQSIRKKIAGWVSRASPGRHASGFGTRTFL